MVYSLQHLPIIDFRPYKIGNNLLELMEYREDAEADVLGWFNCFTADSEEDQLLVVSMVENARDLGGSHYLIKKIKSFI